MSWLPSQKPQERNRQPFKKYLVHVALPKQPINPVWTSLTSPENQFKADNMQTNYVAFLCWKLREVVQCEVEKFRFVNSRLFWIVSICLLFIDLNFSTSYHPTFFNFLQGKALPSIKDFKELTWSHIFGFSQRCYM